MSSTFNLTAAIDAWRNELAAQSQLTPDDRHELERHIIDSMADFRARGLADEEAFWLACRRIGRPHQLAEEFEKADPLKVWRQRIFWIALAIFVWRLFTNVVSFMTFAAVAKIQHHAGGYPVDSWLGVVNMLVMTLVPVLFFVLISNGKLVPQLQRSLALIRDRHRLARTLLILLLLTISTRIAIEWALSSGMSFSIFARTLMWYPIEYLNELLLGVTVIWLKPIEPKALKTA